MTRVIEFLISMLIVVALFLVIGLTLPSRRTFVYQTETNRPMATVNDLFNGFGRFKDWSPLVRRDPHIQFNVEGPAFGEGAIVHYASTDPTIGQGSWKIVESKPGEMVRYELQNNARGHDKSMTIRLERTGQKKQNVQITQEYRVDYGWDLLGRYAGMYVSRNVGDDIKRGLDRIANLMATIPKFDYSQHTQPFEFVNMPAQNVLLVSTAAKRTNEDIAKEMENQIAWIKKVMASNNLVADGPLRIVTSEFTTASYGFDVVQPVRRARPGETPPPADAPAAEGAADAGAEAPADAAATTDVAVSTAPAELLTPKLEGPVKYEQVPARRLARTTFTGSAPALARVRDLLRAWAMTHGADVTDRPFEEYLDPISKIFDDDARFRVYWPVKQ
jgi:hypothetical protein